MYLKAQPRPFAVKLNGQVDSSETNMIPVNLYSSINNPFVSLLSRRIAGNKGHLQILPLIAILSVSCGDPDPEQVRRNLFLPQKNHEPDIRRGGKVYHDTCVVCHGTRGRGSRQGPPLVHSTYRPGHHHDLAFFLAVKNGVKQHHWDFGHMPPMEGISPEDVSDIVAYIRHEQQGAGIK